MKKQAVKLLILLSLAVPAFASAGDNTNVQQALTTKAQVKTVPGGLFGYAVYNPNASAVWVEWYDSKVSPTLGSTAGLIFQVAVPAGGTLNIEFANGINFNSGIWVGVATTANGATAPATGLTVTTVYR